MTPGELAESDTDSVSIITDPQPESGDSHLDSIDIDMNCDTNPGPSEDSLAEGRLERKDPWNEKHVEERSERRVSGENHQALNSPVHFVELFAGVGGLHDTLVEAFPEFKALKRDKLTDG